MSDDVRRREIADGLRDVQQRIAAAAASAGRSPGDVHLVVITKTFPVADVVRLAELDVRDVGENRHQEAEAKAAETAGLGLTWHFVGQLQSNKAARVAAYADVVHSVDSARLARRLGGGARQQQRTVTCLVQVSLDPAESGPGRGGVDPSRVLEVAGAIAGEDGLRLGGLMAVAPLGEPPEPAFARLSGIADRLRAAYPAATMISAGMSGDYPAAIAAGATHVRVGSAILGARSPLR